MEAVQFCCRSGCFADQWVSSGNLCIGLRPGTPLGTRSCEPQVKRQQNRELGLRVRKCDLGKCREPVSQCLTGACVAVGSEETLRELQNNRSQIQLRELPPEVLDWEPESPVELDRITFINSLRSSPRTSETLTDESDATEFFVVACNLLAQGKVPAEIREALMGARLTALLKPKSGVRGIATGCTVRRLVARTLAKQFMKAFEAECAPFQYALSTRAGPDCVGHMLRAASDANPNMTILTVDGVGAYDHVLRSAMLGRLHSMPAARSLLPFVRMTYAQPSSYQWIDAGRRGTFSDSGRGWGSRGTLLCRSSSPSGSRVR